MSGGGSYTIFDLKGKEVEKGKSPAGDTVHFANFFDCIRAGKRPNSDIEEGQKSTLLCHLGNIAFRTGRTLTIDPKTRAILNDNEATAMRRREYRAGLGAEGVSRTDRQPGGPVAWNGASSWVWACGCSVSP